MLLVNNGCLTQLLATPPKGSSLPQSMLNRMPSKNAELRVSDNVNVIKFDDFETYWGPGSFCYIPAGKHTVTVKVESIKELKNIQYTFLPGKSYMIDFETTNFNTETSRSYGLGGSETITTITTIAGNIRLKEYGVMMVAVPGRNESLVEIKLGVGSYTFVFANGNDYKVSSYETDAAKSVRFILPAGTHRIGSLATANDLNLDLPPNRRVVYSINTSSASWTKELDQPLNYIGKWYFSIGNDRSMVLTFSTNGTGYNEMYTGDTLMDNSGFLTYTATDKEISLTDPNEASINMPYQLSSDQNSIYLDNFLGSSQTFIGTR
jgi:hypothetical protein